MQGSSANALTMQVQQQAHQPVYSFDLTLSNALPSAYRVVRSSRNFLAVCGRFSFNLQNIVSLST